MEEDDNKLKITCQCCNGFVTCSVRSEEMFYITFIHSGMSTLGIYPEVLYVLAGQVSNTKMKFIYKISELSLVVFHISFLLEPLSTGDP